MQKIITHKMTVDLNIFSVLVKYVVVCDLNYRHLFALFFNSILPYDKHPLSPFYINTLHINLYLFRQLVILLYIKVIRMLDSKTSISV
jgi:hypothetical protein